MFCSSHWKSVIISKLQICPTPGFWGYILASGFLLRKCCLPPPSLSPVPPKIELVFLGLNVNKGESSLFIKHIINYCFTWLKTNVWIQRICHKKWMLLFLGNDSPLCVFAPSYGVHLCWVPVMGRATLGPRNGRSVCKLRASRKFDREAVWRHNVWAKMNR